MTEKAPFDLDAALAALTTNERAARPTVSESLQTRVLGDAAMVSAERAAAVVPPRQIPEQSPEQNPVQSPLRSSGFRLFGLFDAWSSAAIAAVAVCLMIGLGVGYGAGPDLMAHMGLGDVVVAAAADDGDGLFLSEDVL